MTEPARPPTDDPVQRPVPGEPRYHEPSYRLSGTPSPEPTDPAAHGGPAEGSAWSARQPSPPGWGTPAGASPPAAQMGFGVPVGPGVPGGLGGQSPPVGPGAPVGQSAPPGWGAPAGPPSTWTGARPLAPPPPGAWARPKRVEPVAGTPFGVVHLDVPPVTSGLAVGALVAGIVALVVALLVGCLGTVGVFDGWGVWAAGTLGTLGVLIGAGAVVAGLVALRQIRRATSGAEIRFTGRGLALGGVACGASGAVLTLLGLGLALLLQLG